MIAGFGIPVENLHLESVTIGYILKATYFLPYNITQLEPLRDLQENDILISKRETTQPKYLFSTNDDEAYKMNDFKEERTSYNVKNSRVLFYKNVEKVLER